MPNRLEPINLIDFTGGLNLRRNQFQLAPNESPEMINMVVDPLGGICTRKGWRRWNGPDIVPDASTWDPRRAFLNQLSDGTDTIYIAASNRIYTAAAIEGATYVDLGIDVTATPHMADFASFGDDLYIAGGVNQPLRRRHLLEVPVSLTFAGAGSFNDDYLNPAGGVGPRCEVIEAHAGYLFAANIQEDEIVLANRLRWSHPTSPTDWHSADFIDILTGGSHITGLISYEDHLLIFKHDSIWALYGYNSESWQLVQKAGNVGAVSPQGISRNEGACFFYSASDRGAIYAYTGERPAEISEPMRHCFESIISTDLVWVGWLGRKLWVTVPWTYDGPTSDNAAVLVYDPTVGDRGAWMYFTSISGTLGPVVGGSNIDSLTRPLGVYRATETPCVVQLDALEAANDQIWEYAALGFTAPGALPPDDEGYIMTDTGVAEIVVGGAIGSEPFDTAYRTPWITASWPSRKKSFRRPDFICKLTGLNHQLRVKSFRDFEELNARRAHIVEVPSGAPIHIPGTPGTIAAVWNTFAWNDGTLWNQAGDNPEDEQLASKSGASIRRGSSFGLARALQLRVEGITPKAQWCINAIVVKVVMRRFR